MLGCPYVVIAFVEGSTDAPDTGVASYIELTADTLVQVHRTDVASLPTLPLRTDPRQDLFDILPKGAEWCELRTSLSRLESTEFRGKPRLLHGDFWPGNLLFSDGQISAILDWEDSALGDPLSDVACTCLELRYIYGKEGMQAFRKAYKKHEHLDAARLALWLIHVAAVAQENMEGWALEPSQEAQMRRAAMETLREAASSITAADIEQG